MVRHSIVHIHHTFHPTLMLTLLLPPNVLFFVFFNEKLAFFLLSVLTLSSKERKVGHGQMERTVVRTCRVDFYLFIFLCVLVNSAFFVDVEWKRQKKRKEEGWEKKYWSMNLNLWSTLNRWFGVKKNNSSHSFCVNELKRYKPNCIHVSLRIKTPFYEFCTHKLRLICIFTALNAVIHS